jgi:threonine dehydratase
MSSLDFSDILQARQHLHGIVRQTPFERSAALSDRTNMEVHLKAECLQRTGSFKLRGAYHRIASLSSQEKTRGNLDYPLLKQIIADFSGIAK